ncbi:MAG TPA: hypothetical protein VFI68_11710 [Anaerolineales bacterium]|nr:hypothetical protein [Anaerolineales bacterium]
MQKISILLIALLLVLSACDVWSVQPQPFPGWTTVPSRTPGIVTATPIILTLPYTQTADIISITTVTPTNTEAPSATLTPAQSSPSATVTPLDVQSVSVEILGCNTSIDITHGMGEVTNAYVILKNAGTSDVTNLCALLRAVDEDREHPDKKVCITNLPGLNQVTLKLTVDSAYKQDTAIQVDASANDVLLSRTEKPSCTDIGLFGGAPSDLGVIKPIIQP